MTAWRKVKSIRHCEFTPASQYPRRAGPPAWLTPHAAVPGVLDQPREIARHRCGKAIQFAERLLGAPHCLHRLIALSRGAVDERLDALDQTELRIVLAPEPLEGNERLEQERKVARQHDGCSRRIADTRWRSAPIFRSLSCMSA